MQRAGVPILPESVRVRAALGAGADIVIALPAPYACATAEQFAAAGVQLLAALGWILYSAHQDGWPPPEDPQITGVYFYDAAGQEIAKSDFGWYLFPPDSTVNVAVTFQDGREHTVDQVVLFLYPTGTGVAEERQQIGVRRIRDGRTFALFRWQIPASLYSHLEVQLECGDGQTISVSQWNVIDRDSAF